MKSGNAWTLEALLQPEVLDELLLSIYGPQWLADYRQVLASQWSKYYFMCLWPAVMGASPTTSLVWEASRIHLGSRGLPQTIEWSGCGAGGGLPELVEGHLRPFIIRFGALTQVPARVLWSNAGDTLDQALRGRPASNPLHAALAALRMPDGSPNPLYGTVRYSRDGARHVRACCLAYRVPGIGHCKHCPVSR